MSKLLDLLLPTPCVLCDKLGSPLCTGCKYSFGTQLTSINVLDVQGFAFSEYNKESGLIINGIKEKGLTSLSPLVADLMIASWPAELHGSVLVPLPSSPSNSKKRGFSHTAILARALARKLPDSSCTELLRSSKARSDQVGLADQERAKNMEGAFRAELRGFRQRGRPIVLIDDVLTTGATVGSAIRTLRDSGIEVTSFCVFARARAIKPLFTGGEGLSVAV